MNNLINQTLTLFAVGTVFMQIGVILLVLLLLLRSSKDKNIQKGIALIVDNSIGLVFLVSLGATLGSLFLSEVAGLEPCRLCWFQRGFMYPLAVISGVALYFGERIYKYILSLGIVGLLISLYHILVQWQPQLESCSATSVACSAKQVEYFGYISVPVMSASAFALILLICLLSLLKNKSK